MKRYCDAFRPDIDVLVPQLPSYPLDAAQCVETLIRHHKHTHNIGVVASSLGGYYAAWANHLFDVRAVLVNPAVKPYDLLVNFLGDQKNPYTHECYRLTEQHIMDLKTLDVDVIRVPESLWILLQTGDEILDYQQAIKHYSLCEKTVEEGGDHSFVDFERYAKRIIEFLQL